MYDTGSAVEDRFEAFAFGRPSNIPLDHYCTTTTTADAWDAIWARFSPHSR